MTKLKYENQGGRGFRTFYPFSNLSQKTTKKKEKEPTKNELLLKDLKKNYQMKYSPWKIEDLSYKKIKMGHAIKILLNVVHSKSEICPILKELRKNQLLYNAVKRKIESNYVNISSSALKIVLEQNKDFYKSNQGT